MSFFGKNSPNSRLTPAFPVSQDVCVKVATNVAHRLEKHGLIPMFSYPVLQIRTGHWLIKFDFEVFFRRGVSTQVPPMFRTTRISRASRAAFCMQFAYHLQIFIFYLETNFRFQVQDRRCPSFVLKTPGCNLDVLPGHLFQVVFPVLGSGVFDVA